MAKRKKSKKVKVPTFYKVGMTIFGFSMVFWLASSLFVRSFNINLSMEQQQIQSKISTLQVENDALRVEIQTLENRDRITNIAEDEDMMTRPNNIVTIGN